MKRSSTRESAARYGGLGRRLAPCLAGLAAIACSDDAVLLTVDSELEVPAQLDAICLSVADEDPAGGVFSRRYPLDEGGLPQSLAVEPGSAEGAIAQARGQLRGAEVARARAGFSFSGSGDVALGLAACGPGELGDPEVREAAGVAADAVAISRGARGDLLIALAPNEAAILAPTETGLEAARAAPPAPPAAPRAVIAADVDGSCEDDVIVASERGIDLWRRAGDELVQDEAGFSDASADLVAVAAADLDGGGAIDVVAGGGGELSIYRGDGAGGFVLDADAIPAGAVSDVTSIALADLTGDGRMDILVGQGDEQPAPLVALAADPGTSGAFVVAEGAVPAVAYRARRVVASSRPGAPADAFVATDEGVVHLVNRGDGRLEDRTAVTLPGADGIDVADVAVGDWDGDCRPDLIAAPVGAELRLWSGQEGGGFAEAGGLGSVGLGLVLDDLGGLGRRDLVIADGDGVSWVTR